MGVKINYLTKQVILDSIGEEGIEKEGGRRDFLKRLAVTVGGASFLSLVASPVKKARAEGCYYICYTNCHFNCYGNCYGACNCNCGRKGW